MNIDITSKSGEDSSDMEKSLKEATKDATSLNEDNPMGDGIDQVSQDALQSEVSELNDSNKEDGKGDQVVNRSQDDDIEAINNHQDTIESIDVNEEEQVRYEQNSDSDIQEDFVLKYDDDDEDEGDQMVNCSQDDNKKSIDNQETVESINSKQVQGKHDNNSDIAQVVECAPGDSNDKQSDGVHQETIEPADVCKVKEAIDKHDNNSDIAHVVDCAQGDSNDKQSDDVHQETIEPADVCEVKEAINKHDNNSDIAQVVDCAQGDSNDKQSDGVHQETIEPEDVCEVKEAIDKHGSSSGVQEMELKYIVDKDDQVSDGPQDNDDMCSTDIHLESVESEKLEKLARCNESSSSNIQEEMELKCNDEMADTKDSSKCIDVHHETVESVQNEEMQNDDQMKEENLQNIVVDSEDVKIRKEDSNEEIFNETMKSQDVIENKVEKSEKMQADDHMKEEKLQEIVADSNDTVKIDKEDRDEEILTQTLKSVDVTVNKAEEIEADDQEKEEKLQEINTDIDNLEIRKVDSDEEMSSEAVKSDDVTENKTNTDDKDTEDNIIDVINEIDKIVSVNETSKENDELDDEDGEKTDKLNEGNKHRINKPDVMIEIPSRELIYFDDDLEEDLLNTDNSDLINDQIDADTSAKNTNEADQNKPVSNETKTKSKDLEEKNEVDLEKEETEAPVNRTDTVQEPEVFPSTSGLTKMAPDASDEVPEVTDSLGLLAESSRVVEDEEEPDDDDDGDDEDDFDQDDESNQMTAEHSEDSNAHQSETDAPKMETETDERDGQEFVEEKEMVSDMKNFEFTISNVVSEKADENMEVNEVGDKEVKVPSVLSDEETIKATKALENLLSGTYEETGKEDDQMSVETVKLSDVSDNETEAEAAEIKVHQDVTAEEKKKDNQQTEKPPATKETVNAEKQSPSKTKNLEIAQPTHVVNIVDLEESSSEDDLQEVEKPTETEPELEPSLAPEPETEEVVEATDVTSVNIPSDIEIMCTSAGNTSEIVTREKEVVISGVPKPKVPHKPARLNTSEVTIKTTTTASESTLVIPETKMDDTKGDKSKPKFNLEVFTLDSDDEDATASAIKDTTPKKMTALEMDKARETNKCINYSCTSDATVCYVVADAATMAYYDAARKRKAMVCKTCADVVAKRTKGLVEGIKNLTPLLELDMGKLSQELVEISDSESDDEGEASETTKEMIGVNGAKILEEQLADMINSTWRKFKMDARLRDAQKELNDEIEILEKESKEIDNMLNECQVATDKLRTELYATFEHERQELRAIEIYDTPEHKYSGMEDRASTTETRQSKRRLSTVSETPAKRPAIPLGYAPLDADSNAQTVQEPKSASSTTEVLKLDDDNVDISVVKLSAEAAPADLPPPGEITRPPIRHGMFVYGMRNNFRSWLLARVVEILPKTLQFTMCRVKFEHNTKSIYKTLPARCLAYNEPAYVRMTIGTRVIALFKDSANSTKESFYSGIIAEIPNPVNNYRYLVFFDDGYAQYVQHSHTRLVCECSSLVWEEVHPFSRQFVREYLLAYPERPMVRLHAGQSLKTEWNGKWWVSRVIQVDASLVQVHFEEDNRTEWIYRGSTRLAPLYLELQAAERHRARPMPRSTSNKSQAKSNMPYVEYTRSDEQGNKTSDAHSQIQQNEEMRRQRAVAKKSTVTVTVNQQPPPPPPPTAVESVTSRVVYYTPKNAVKPYKMFPHTCGPKCKRSDVLALKDLRTYNPLAKPLLSGWERQIVRYRGRKDVIYRAPCGRRLRTMQELHRYLRDIKSDMPVDLFDYHPNTHCLAEFVLNKCLVSKKDLSHGKENVPVPCVNYYDDSLPEFCSYNTERTPTAGVPLNLDPEFLCGCDCTDDCEDKTKCACWKMTLEGARTIGLKGPDVGYVYKRLPEPLQSGIYECNSRCKCKATCLNRVAQHPLQLKLQVFKTMNRGWGIRALNDVPKGAFLCVYAGNLLTDATANLDGLNEGDEYLAELDYIEVVEQMKEGYEDDIPEADKILDKKEGAKQNTEDDEEEEMSSSEDEASNHDKEDDDFKPAYDVVQESVTEFKKNLRKRTKKNAEEMEGEKEKDKEKTKEKESNGEEDCITISDDDEVREPSRFMAQAGMGGKEFVPKHRSVRSYFGKDEACYIMDAKVQGNIGRYLNHSCCPNVFVQNVFVDTHDPRFPWVAFFALNHIRAGTELTWNYNYDVGSVPGKVLYCYCGAPNCRGRLL